MSMGILDIILVGGLFLYLIIALAAVLDRIEGHDKRLDDIERREATDDPN